MVDLIRHEPTPRPSLTYVWGRSRPVVNTFAAAWALELCPDPAWIEIRADSDPEETGPTAGDLLPADRRFRVTDPAELAPNSPVSDAALGSVVRPEGGSELRTLVDYLSIPPILREVANRPRTGAIPLVIVLANCERLRPYWSAAVGEGWSVAGALRRSGVSVVITVIGPPDPARRRSECDTIVEVAADSLGAWRRGTATAERAPSSSRLRPSEPVPLPTIPSVARLLERLTAGP